jgi:hypothetical protein
METAYQVPLGENPSYGSQSFASCNSFQKNMQVKSAGELTLRKDCKNQAVLLRSLSQTEKAEK